MIRQIGVLCQDVISLGFLEGIKRRFGCAATLVQPVGAPFEKVREMTRGKAKLAHRIFNRKGVDLIVRLTDADQVRWQDVRRHEKDVFADVESIFVCGVAVQNIEEWLALDHLYIAEQFSISPNEIAPGAPDRSAKIKHALARAKPDDMKMSDFVAGIVEALPGKVFETWLRNCDSLRHFVDDCRASALRANCPISQYKGE